jgi:hypothetical protein
MADTTKAPQGESLEEATEKGYIGTTPDDTPDRNYTVAGVVAKAPTPEAPKADKPAAITRENVAGRDK